MVVSSDKGDSLDVHPRDKRPVGERLARWALNQEYGYLNLIPSGPLFKRAHTQKDQVIIEFNYGEGLQSSDGEKLVGFEIAETEGYTILQQPLSKEIKLSFMPDKSKNLASSAMAGSHSPGPI